MVTAVGMVCMVVIIMSVSILMNLIAPSASLPLTGAKMLGVPMKGKILTLPSPRPR